MTVPRETEAAILRLHYGEHWPYGTIATQLGVHIDVVRRVLNRPPAGAAAPTARRPSVVQPYGGRAHSPFPSASRCWRTSRTAT